MPPAIAPSPDIPTTEFHEDARYVEATCPDLDFWDDKNRLNWSRKRLCVGRLRKFPCSQPLMTEWEKDILPYLMHDLRATCSWFSPNEVFEAELRMAGYVLSGESKILLGPTVCIRCTTRGCKKEFRKAVKDLSYLACFCSGRFEVRRGAPQFAGTGGEPHSETRNAEEQTDTI